MLFVSRAERHLGHPPANSFAGVRPLVSGDTGQRQQSRAVPHEPCPQQVSFSRPKGSLKDTNYRNARDVPYIFSFCISLALICASDALSLPGLSPFPFPVICMHHLHSPHLLTAPTLFFSSLPFLCANHCFLCVRATRGQLPNSFRPTTPSIPFLHVVVHSVTSQLSFFFLSYYTEITSFPLTLPSDSVAMGGAIRWRTSLILFSVATVSSLRLSPRLCLPVDKVQIAFPTKPDAFPMVPYCVRTYSLSLRPFRTLPRCHFCESKGYSTHVNCISSAVV